MCGFVYVCVPADVMEGKNALLLGMSQWNSNDLVEQIETLGHMEGRSHGIYTHTNTCIDNQTHTNMYTRLSIFLLTHPEGKLQMTRVTASVMH